MDNEKSSKLISLVVPVSKKGNEYLCWMQTRREEGRLNGKLEFPGGKIENSESPKSAAIREFQEEVGVELREEDLELFKIYPFEYVDRKVILYVFTLFKDFVFSQGNWYKLSEQDLMNQIPDANIEIFEDLKRYLKNE